MHILPRKFILLSLLLILTNNSFAQDQNKCEELSGFYQITETIDMPDCGQHLTQKQSFQLTQKSCQISVVDNTSTGVVTGHRLNWNVGKFDSNGGEVTVQDSYYTVENNSVTGLSNWIWKRGKMQCRGTTSFAGYRHDKKQQVAFIPASRTLNLSDITIQDHQYPTNFSGGAIKFGIIVKLRKHMEAKKNFKLF